MWRKLLSRGLREDPWPPDPSIPGPGPARLPQGPQASLGLGVPPRPRGLPRSLPCRGLRPGQTHRSRSRSRRWASVPLPRSCTTCRDLGRPVETREPRQRDGHQQKHKQSCPRGELRGQCLRPADTLQARAAGSRSITGRPHLASWRTHSSPGGQSKEAPPPEAPPRRLPPEPGYPDVGACCGSLWIGGVIWFGDGEVRLGELRRRPRSRQS